MRPPSNGGPARFAVSERAFRRQLDFLEGRRLRGFSLEMAMQAPASDRVAMSFDDGTLGQFERAVPALLDRGMTATFFVVTSWIGRPGYMDEGQLRELKAAGMSVQSHTRSHRYLSELDPDQAWCELRGSKEDLDAALQQDTDTIALPGGDLPRRSLYGLFREAGYRVVATSQWGKNVATRLASRPKPLFVRRCTVRGEPSAKRFCSILDQRLPDVAVRETRDGALRVLKHLLGRSRYARLRGAVLDRVGGRDRG